MVAATCRWFGIVAVAVVSFGMAGCSAGPRSDSESAVAREDGDEHAASEEAGERASAEGGEHARSEEAGEHARSERGSEHGRGREGGEGEHGEEGEEEPGVYIGLEETWDVTRNGARLVLSFEPAANAFAGRVENTTGETLCAVRVEVHLSTGTELGPTARTDLPAGEPTSVELPTGGEDFDTWTAHPEMSRCTGA